MCVPCAAESARSQTTFYTLYVVNCRKAVKFYLYNFIAVFYLPQKPPKNRIVQKG